MTRLLDFLAAASLGVLAALVVAVAALPLTGTGHLLLAGALLLLAVTLKLARPARYCRFLLLAIAGFLVLRYAIWRTAETLPSMDEPVTFAVGLALYAAEAYAMVMLAINLLVVIDPIRRETPAWPEDPDALPSVDVYVPSYNESPELVANTLRAAVRLDYPTDRLRVYLLDDGASDQRLESDDPQVAEAARARRAVLQEICAEVGATYLNRVDNAGAKAGNLNAAFHRTNGDLIAIFDADHAPMRDFLRHTVTHFLDDPRLFLVQTPHVFLNGDPLERNLGLEGRMPGESEMFYGLVQSGLDRWNASFFCGSAALLRRVALAEENGFSGISVTEDCETALDLHARGWNSRYVAKPLVLGLNPETFSSFVGQRARWLQGMMQIFLKKNPLTRRGLSLAQRFCYLSSQMFWLFPLPRLIFFLAPLTYLFAGLEIYVADLGGFLAHAVPYLIAIMLLSDFVYGRVRRPFISDLYETIQCVHLVRALIEVLLRPLRPNFTVTAKGDRLDRDHLSPLVWPFLGLTLLLAAGLAAAVARYQGGDAALPVLTIVSAFTGFNLLLSCAALGVCCERRQLRAQPRLPVSRPVRVWFGGRSFDAEIRDVSPGGAGLLVPGVMPETLRGEQTFAVELTDAAGLPDCRLPLDVRRRRVTPEGVILHAAFQPEDPSQRFVVTHLNYGDSAPLARLLAARQRARGTLRGGLLLCWLAVRGLYTTVRYLAAARRPRGNRGGRVHVEVAAGFDAPERLA